MRYGGALILLIATLFLPSAAHTGRKNSSLDLRQKVKKFLAACAQGKDTAARTFLAPDARIWFEERTGPGDLWEIPGTWSNWDRYFHGHNSYSNWQQVGQQVTVLGKEINDFYRLIDRPPQAFQATWWFNEQGQITGFLFQPLKAIGKDRLKEFKDWAKQKYPEELNYLMPNGKFDPGGERPQRWHRILVEWRKAAGLPTIKLESK